MTISLCIVHWNTPELLEKQLEFLFSDHTNSEHHVEVIVVDNHSSSLPTEKVRNKFPEVKFLFLPLNMGYSFACNQAAAQAHGTWLWFLNTDIEISKKDVCNMVKEAMEQKLVAFSPVDASPNYQKPIPSFASLIWEFSPLHRFVPRHLFRSHTLLGGCLCIHREVFSQLKGWDERFFLWFEDSDLSMRLQQYGHAFGVLSNFSIKHLGGVTFKKLDETYTRAVFFRSLLSYAEKYFSFFEKKVIHGLVHRFAQNHLLPADPEVRVSLVVPNMHRQILENFLIGNNEFFHPDKDELIIVTSDETVLELKVKYPQVIFIFNRQNHGFAQMVNTGFSRARGKHIGTVNDDTLLQKNWLDPLCAVCVDRVASVTPVVKKSDGQIESAGVTVLAHGKAQTNTTVTLPLIESNAFNAAAVLFQRSALERVGLFDESFGSYLEDLDLGLRFTRAGYQNLCCSEVSITHFGQRTSQHFSRYRLWLNVKNWWILMWKNFGILHWLRYGPQIFLERARNVSGFLKGIFV